MLSPRTNAIVRCDIPTATNGYYNIALQSNNKVWYIGSGLFAPPAKIGVLQTGSPDDNQGDDNQGDN